MKSLLIIAALCAGCAEFEDPTVVRDLRVLAMTANPPEQVIDFDLQHPPTPAQVLAQLQPTAILATIADPGQERRVRWSMIACVLDTGGGQTTGGGGERCDDGAPQALLGSGIVDDPDVHATPEMVPVPENQPWAIVPNTSPLDEILFAALEADDLHGLGGVDYGVVLRIGGEGADPALDQFAAKTVRVSPRIPAARTPNHNPALVDIQFSLDGESFTNLNQGPCNNEVPPQVVPSGGDVTVYPDETANAREMYYAPTLDGAGELLTETLTYQWLATDGGFSDATTGGDRDVAGNPSLLGTVWHAPEVTAVERTQLWVIQRDERLGAAVYPFCLSVTP